jgi:hypothetical protein
MTSTVKVRNASRAFGRGVTTSVKRLLIAVVLTAALVAFLISGIVITVTNAVMH